MHRGVGLTVGDLGRQAPSYVVLHRGRPLHHVAMEGGGGGSMCTTSQVSQLPRLRAGPFSIDARPS
jgi:hypothetical protein